jgi:hypothetical protein
LNISYLFVSHDLAVVEHIAHRIVVMYLGRIVESGSRETFWRQPLHPHTRALLDAAPVADRSTSAARRAKDSRGRTAARSTFAAAARFTSVAPSQKIAVETPFQSYGQRTAEISWRATSSRRQTFQMSTKLDFSRFRQPCADKYGAGFPRGCGSSGAQNPLSAKTYSIKTQLRTLSLRCALEGHQLSPMATILDVWPMWALSGGAPAPTSTRR